MKFEDRKFEDRKFEDRKIEAQSLVHLLEGSAGDGTIKNPVQTAGFCGSVWARSLSRASISSPRKGSFFRRRCTQVCNHLQMMIDDAESVNRRGLRRSACRTKKSRAHTSPA